MKNLLIAFVAGASLVLVACIPTNSSSNQEGSSNSLSSISQQSMMGGMSSGLMMSSGTMMSSSGMMSSSMMSSTLNMFAMICTPAMQTRILDSNSMKQWMDSLQMAGMMDSSMVLVDSIAMSMDSVSLHNYCQPSSSSASLVSSSSDGIDHASHHI